MTKFSVKTNLVRMLVAVLVAWPFVSFAKEVTVRTDLDVIFTKNHLDGTFVLFDPTTQKLVIVNENRSAKRMYPASTFKIANSLIALETGVVADENEIIPYGGQPQPIASWEKDMSMREAIKVSNVPVYQELARRVGADRYAEWLETLNYGDKQVGDSIETFWLKGPLKISAVEQVNFIDLLAHQKLNANQQSQLIVRDILEIESRGNSTLFAKTGWTNKPTPDIGWFVGWVEADGEVFPFALNIDLPTAADAKKRKTIAVEILEKLGVY